MSYGFTVVDLDFFTGIGHIVYLHRKHTLCNVKPYISYPCKVSVFDCRYY